MVWREMFVASYVSDYGCEIIHLHMIYKSKFESVEMYEAKKQKKIIWIFQ